MVYHLVYLLDCVSFCFTIFGGELIELTGNWTTDSFVFAEEGAHVLVFLLNNIAFSSEHLSLMTDLPVRFSEI